MMTLSVPSTKPDRKSDNSDRNSGQAPAGGWYTKTNKTGFSDFQIRRVRLSKPEGFKHNIIALSLDVL